MNGWPPSVSSSSATSMFLRSASLMSELASWHVRKSAPLRSAPCKLASPIAECHIDSDKLAPLKSAPLTLACVKSDRLILAFANRAPFKSESRKSAPSRLRVGISDLWDTSETTGGVTADGGDSGSSAWPDVEEIASVVHPTTAGGNSRKLDGAFVARSAIGAVDCGATVVSSSLAMSGPEGGPRDAKPRPIRTKIAREIAKARAFSIVLYPAAMSGGNWLTVESTRTRGRRQRGT